MVDLKAEKILRKIIGKISQTLSDESSQPIICLGSDDPGIFATSLRAEYYHVYRVLTSKKFNQSPTEAIDILEKLHRNAERFRFTPENNLRMRQH